MKKIALYIPSMQGGGAEKVFVTLANYFVSIGYKVDLLLTLKIGPYLEKLDSRINIYELSSKKTSFDLFRLVNYLKNNTPDVLLSALTHTNIIAMMANVLAGNTCPVYISEHANFSENIKILSKGKQLIFKSLVAKFYPKSKGIICVSGGVKDDLIHNFPSLSDKITVIYNPFEISVIKQKSQEPVNHPWLQNNRPFKTIISAGRLNLAKDFHTLLAAFLLVRKNCDVKLLILGEGELRDDLMQFVKTYGLEQVVNLHGFVNNPFAYISKADAFVLSSKYEGLSNVLIESMICGVPLVSTDCPSGPAEILENGKWGTLVPVGDYEKLAQAIVHVLGDNKLIDYTSRIKDFDYRKIGNDYINYILKD